MRAHRPTASICDRIRPYCKPCLPIRQYPRQNARIYAHMKRSLGTKRRFFCMKFTPPSFVCSFLPNVTEHRPVFTNPPPFTHTARPRPAAHIPGPARSAPALPRTCPAPARRPRPAARLPPPCHPDRAQRVEGSCAMRIGDKRRYTTLGFPHWGKLAAKPTDEGRSAFRLTFSPLPSFVPNDTFPRGGRQE